MANSKTNLTWHEVDTKLAFQAQFITELRKQSMIEAAETMAFAYKFGKLSIAKVDVEAERPKSSAKPKFKF